MKTTNRINDCILAAGVFTDTDRATVTAFQDKAEKIQRHQKLFNVGFLDHDIEATRVAYGAEPSDEKLDAFQAALIIREHRTSTLASMEAMVDDVYRKFLQSEFSPWMAYFGARLVAAVEAFCAQIVAEERARSIELIGNEEGADGVLKVVERIVPRLKAFVDYFPKSGGGPHAFFRNLKNTFAIEFEGVDYGRGVDTVPPETEAVKAMRRAGVHLDPAPRPPLEKNPTAWVIKHPSHAPGSSPEDLGYWAQEIVKAESAIHEAAQLEAAGDAGGAANIRVPAEEMQRYALEQVARLQAAQEAAPELTEDAALAQQIAAIPAKREVARGDVAAAASNK